MAPIGIFTAPRKKRRVSNSSCPASEKEPDPKGVPFAFSIRPFLVTVIVMMVVMMMMPIPAPEMMVMVMVVVMMVIVTLCQLHIAAGRRCCRRLVDGLQHRRGVGNRFQQFGE
jgi:uncharacterized protein (DUF983 family)